MVWEDLRKGTWHDIRVGVTTHAELTDVSTPHAREGVFMDGIVRGIFTDDFSTDTSGNYGVWNISGTGGSISYDGTNKWLNITGLGYNSVGTYHKYWRVRNYFDISVRMNLTNVNFQIALIIQYPVGVTWSGIKGGIRLMFDGDGDKLHVTKTINGTGTTLYSKTWTATTGWYKIRIKREGKHWIFYDTDATTILYETDIDDKELNRLLYFGTETRYYTGGGTINADDWSVEMI